MAVLHPADIYLLKTTALGASLYVTNSLLNRLFGPKTVTPPLPLLEATGLRKPPAIQPTRSILKQLTQTGKPCMVLYGSQTGTAEKFANRFARDASERYGLGCVVGDLDDYDFGDLAKLSQKHLLIFILATYGEGEPTDNAITFQNFLDTLTTPAGLPDLHYCAFGLGSSSYTHYNAMIRGVDNALTSQKAHRIGPVGLGDDGKGTLEEDFSTWIEASLPPIAAHLSLTEIPRVYRPAFKIVESLPSKVDLRHVFLGQANKSHLYKRVQGPFTATNPFPAPIIEVRELFTTPNRSCLHFEFDTSGTTISYDTGDHLAIWPANSDLQVHLFLTAFGLHSKKDHVIDICPSELTGKVPLPAKTTYEAAVRHYLDICAIVTRRILRELSDFATSESIREHLRQLAEDKARFANEVTARKLTLAQLLASISSNSTSQALSPPFSLILELIPRLRPRHYSISSSSLTSRKTISVTAVIDEHEDPDVGISFRGVSTGYLSALKNQQEQQPQATHSLNMPKTDNGRPAALIHVRRSKFRLPFDASVPVIMVGAGTGVAPFRAFVRQRAHQYGQGRTMGRTILFYGCRDPSQDFLYKDEWQDVCNQSKLGPGMFDIYTAFSRHSGGPRQYVQDLMAESNHAEEVRRLMLEQKAVFYVCGNAARMAKDVSRTMVDILGSDDCIAQYKREGRWFEDVW